MFCRDVKKLKPLDRFVYWITERESIRRKKDGGEPRPWTDDTILAAYRFCNVRRMDDRVSRWLLDNWYVPYYNHPNMVVAVVLARFINLPSSLEAVGFPDSWDPEYIKSTLEGLKSQGLTVFNAAYMVRGNDGPNKVVSVVDYNVQHLYEDPPLIDRSSMRKTWQEIVPRYGMGSFMAGQVVADLRWALEGEWKDRRSWAPAGPGSTRGMNRLLGVTNIKARIPQETFVKNLMELAKTCRQSLPPKITRRLEAQDWQSCLCEYDKYERTLWGEGRPKRLYPGS